MIDFLAGMALVLSMFHCKWWARGSNRVLAAILASLLLGSSTASAGMLWYQDWEAARWKTNLAATAGPLAGNTYVAATRFMLQTRAAGQRQIIVRANLQAGVNLLSARTPIITDLGTATDTKNGSDPTYTEANGITVSGTTQLLETGINPTNLNVNSAGLAVYAGGTAGAESSLPIGCAAFGGNEFYIATCFTAAGQTSDIWGTTGRTITADTSGIGFYMGTRNSSATNGVSSYRNGNLTGRSTSETGSPPDTGSGPGIFVMGINNAGSPFFATAKAGRGYMVIRGFSDVQAGASYRIWDRFNRTLGRPWQ